MTHGYRLLIKSARLVHLATTLFGLLLILFFALTGFMLNHEDWFALAESAKVTTTSRLPTGLLVEPDRLGVVEFLRSAGATGVLDGLDIEEDSLHVVFKSPGRQTEVHIERPTGLARMESESRGILGRLTDLHRGKSSGPVWSLVIDGTCVVMLLVSLTGVLLWYSLRTRFRLGLTAITVGLALVAAVYVLAVP